LHSYWPAIQANSFIDGECADSDLAYTYEGAVTQCDDIGDRYRQPGLLANLILQILEQRAASRLHDAAIADVGRKLGRGTRLGKGTILTIANWSTS
jgi:hypothetical protein